MLLTLRDVNVDALFDFAAQICRDENDPVPNQQTTNTEHDPKVPSFV
jgi:hypothetical protein